MPKITCPYCKLESANKFDHGNHLRLMHTQYFERNIRTTITGADHALARPQQAELVIHNITQLNKVVGGYELVVQNTKVFLSNSLFLQHLAVCSQVDFKLDEVLPVINEEGGNSE